MTDNIVNMPTPMNVLADKIRSAFHRCERGRFEWIEGTLELAVLLAEARSRFPAKQEFSYWLVDVELETINHQDRAALINMAADLPLTRIVLEETKRTSWQHIWENEMKPRLSQVSKTTTKPTSMPEPASALPMEAKPDKQEPPKAETKSDDKPPAQKKSDSKLYKLGDEVADVLLTRFTNPKMLAHFLGDDKNTRKRARLLRYLATRVVASDYPKELLGLRSFEAKLLYPYLPQKLLNTYAKNIKLIDLNHPMLVQTETLFVKTPECGVTDPPLVAFNAAYAIYQAIRHSKTGSTIDRSSFVHKQTFAPDEGKRPVIVRGTQLWPRESEENYSYDDLRCAFGMANDILCTFGEPRDVSMSTKSLKLRHVASWIPDSGYNSTGATLEGMLRAWRLVVSAYGADKSQVMENPLPSLIKK